MLALDPVSLRFDEQRMYRRRGLVIKFNVSLGKPSGFGLRDAVLAVSLDHRA